MNRVFAPFMTILLAVLLVPTLAHAQQENDDDDDAFLLRVNGSATIPQGDIVDAAVMINGDITIDGTITDSLVVIKGTATVNGSVGQDITVIRGDLDLRPGATVNDVMLINSDLVQDPAANVSGDVEERSGDFSLGRGFAIFSILWWIGMLILGLVAGAVFAWLGRAQLFGAVETLRSQFVSSLITAIVIWIVLPIAAILVVFTLVGAPLGLSVILVLLPVLLLLGIVVIGAWIGSYIIKSSTTAGAIGMAVVGIAIIAIVSLIPFVAVVAALAGMLGAGALIYRTFNRARSQAPPASPAAAT